MNFSVLRRAFDSFDQKKKGCIGTDVVGVVLKMMGKPVSRAILDETIAEVDVDGKVIEKKCDINRGYLPMTILGSGELDFGEFVLLATKFNNEQDEEEVRQELKEAFRLYDKDGEIYLNATDLRTYSDRSKFYSLSYRRGLYSDRSST